MKADLVSVVDAAYFHEERLHHWLQNLVRTADTAMSGGRGVFGIVVEGAIKGPSDTKPRRKRKSPDQHDIAQRSNILATSYSGLPDRILEKAAPLLEFMPNERALRRYIHAGPVGTLTGVFAERGGEFNRRLLANWLRRCDLPQRKAFASMRTTSTRRLPISRPRWW